MCNAELAVHVTTEITGRNKISMAPLILEEPISIIFIILVIYVTTLATSSESSGVNRHSTKADGGSNC